MSCPEETTYLHEYLREYHVDTTTHYVQIEKLLKWYMPPRSTLLYPFGFTTLVIFYYVDIAWIKVCIHTCIWIYHTTTEPCYISGLSTN